MSPCTKELNWGWCIWTEGQHAAWTEAPLNPTRIPSTPLDVVNRLGLTVLKDSGSSFFCFLFSASVLRSCVFVCTDHHGQTSRRTQSSTGEEGLGRGRISRHILLHRLNFSTVYLISTLVLYYFLSFRMSFWFVHVNRWGRLCSFCGPNKWHFSCPFAWVFSVCFFVCPPLLRKGDIFFKSMFSGIHLLSKCPFLE